MYINITIMLMIIYCNVLVLCKICFYLFWFFVVIKNIPPGGGIFF